VLSLKKDHENLEWLTRDLFHLPKSRWSVGVSGRKSERRYSY